MNTKRIARALAPALLATGALHGETLYEKDSIALEGSVRMVHRAAATCQVLAESESAETYERTKGNHGRPLHAWRVDFSALNGSGQQLSNLTAHFRIASEWPPCTNWTSLGQYPGPVQWAGSFETLQRPGGMGPGEEVAATLYVLAIDGQQPHFSNWQVNYEFGAVTAPSEPAPEPAVAMIPAALVPPPVPEPLCDFENLQRWERCWYEMASPARCHAWLGQGDWNGYPEWTGECVDGLASGAGTLIVTFEGKKTESTGAFRDGKRYGQWVDVRSDGWHEEGPYVDGGRHGRWMDYGVDKERHSDPLIREYENGKQTDAWFLHRNR